MPRKRNPDRIDHIADAATEVFIEDGYGPARIARIAERARVGPGTVYLYAEGKEALFDLALRRALEDPSIWSMTFPHPNPTPGAVADAAWRCLQNASHFPLLWLAAESPPPDSVREEVHGIVQELYRWLYRYRRALRLMERAGSDWPDVHQVFHRRFWRGGVRRVADYLDRRIGEGVLPDRGDRTAAAHLVVESLAWMAVHRGWAPEGSALPADAVEQTTLALLVPALCGGTL